MEEPLKINKQDETLNLQKQQDQFITNTYTLEEFLVIDEKEKIDRESLQEKINKKEEDKRKKEEIVIKEFENLLDQDFDDFELQKKDDKSKKLADEQAQKNFEQGEIDMNLEILEQNENQDLLKDDTDIAFDEQELKKQEREEVNRIEDLMFYHNDEELQLEKEEQKKLQNVEKDSEKMNLFQARNVEMGPFYRKLEEFDMFIEGSGKNEQLFHICEVLNRVTELDHLEDKRFANLSYQKAGFKKGAIANVYLNEFADKKFLRFIEYQRLMNLQKLALLYRKLESRPVPGRYLKEEGDDPRDPVLMRQYAAYVIRNSKAYRDLQGINQITGALQKDMEDGFSAKIGVKSPGEYLDKQRKDLTKALSKDDVALVSKGEEILTDLLEVKTDRLNKEMLTEDTENALRTLRKDVRSLCGDNETDYLQFPKLKAKQKKPSVKRSPGQVWPPLHEGEEFSAELDKRAELTSRFARLLQMGDVVKTVEGAVKQEEKATVSGYIVKKYEGTNVPDAMRSGKSLSVSARKQVAEIVMLNLLCGNTRNLESDLIAEEEKNGAITKVREVSGTEASFGETTGKQILKRYGGGGEMSLLSLGNLSVEAKERILNLSPYMLTEVFGEDLTEKELSALQSRLSAVKQLIRSFEENKKKEQVFAAKKMRKYLNKQKSRKKEDKLASLPPELAEGKAWMQQYQINLEGNIRIKVFALQKDLPKETKEKMSARVYGAIKGKEATLSANLMNQVDRFLALSNSKDFKAKLLANDPAAVAVKRDYEQKIIDATRAYKDRMAEEMKRIRTCKTIEDLYPLMAEARIISEREAYFTSIQNSRYKNNEDSDSMMLVKESVRVLSERSLDHVIKGAQGLTEKLASLNEQYKTAIENCKAYITSHKPLIGFWHEDGKKRYEMVQALAKRLEQERDRIKKNGEVLQQRFLTNEITETSFAELLNLEEFELTRTARLMKEREPALTAEKEDQPVNQKACEMENLISRKKVQEAVAKIRKFKTVDFLERLEFSDPNTLLKNKEKNDSAFREIEQAFSTIRDSLLLGEDFSCLRDEYVKVDKAERKEWQALYASLKDLKKSMEDLGNAVKELALHPMRFTEEGEALSGLSTDELAEKEKTAEGDSKQYIGLLITKKKLEAKLQSIQTVKGYSAFINAGKEEVKNRDKEKKSSTDVLFLKDLVSDLPDPVQEKNRVKKLLTGLYNEKKLKETPPDYVVAHLYGKKKEEIKAFIDRFTSEDVNVRKEALKEIVERGAKDPSMILQNTAANPTEMLVNAEYNYGMALRAASLEKAYEDYKKLSPETPKELDEEARLQIVIAKKLKLDGYEKRFSEIITHIQNTESTTGNQAFISKLNTDTKWRKSMGLLTGFERYKMEELAKETLGENPSPEVMLRFYRQLMMKGHRNKTFLLSDTKLKPREMFTAEEEALALQKYKEREKIREKLSEAEEIYYSRYKEERKEPEYEEKDFREKWEHFKTLKVTDLKMKNVGEIITNVQHNQVIFREASEMRQLLSKALLNGAKISDEELMEADIKIRTIYAADQYMKIIFSASSKELFRYMDVDQLFNMSGKELEDLKGSLESNDDQDLTLFLERLAKEVSKWNLRLGENGMADYEKKIRKKEEGLRKTKEERIKKKYKDLFGKEIPKEELQKRLKDYEKNKAIWGAGGVLTEELFERQWVTRYLLNQYNKEHGTNLDTANPREFSAYLPLLSMEKQKALIEKWGQGDEGMLSVYSDFIDYIINLDFSILQETSTEGMMKNFYKASSMIGLINEVESVWSGFRQCLTDLANKMKKDGKSDDEIDAFIRGKMPSDEVLRKLYAVKTAGMEVATRWMNFRDNILSNPKYDSEVIHGVMTIEDLDQIDHVSFAVNLDEGKMDLDDQTQALIRCSYSYFSKKTLPHEKVVADGTIETTWTIEEDYVERSKNLVKEMEEAQKDAPLKEWKMIDYKENTDQSAPPKK